MENISIHKDNKKEPVLLVDLSQAYGGVDARVIETARGLHGLRDYAVATLEGSPVHQKLIDAGLNAVTVPYGKRDPRNVAALYRIIRRDGYQVVDAHNDQSWLWGLLAAQLAGVPVKVASVQLPCRITPGGYRGWGQEQILHLNRRMGCRFMTVNTLLIDYLHGLGIAREKIALIFNAIELSAHDVDQEPLDMRQLAGWPADTVVFSVIARLVYQKGHDILLTALASAIKTHPQIRCVFVGDGKLEQPLKEQCAELGLQQHVHFMGFRKDIPAILNSSDVFCLPSRSEGLPFALLEACAHKLPLLVSDVDGMKELFEHQRTAYLVPPEDVDKLVEGLIWHVESLDAARELGVAAHHFVQQRLSPQLMVQETLAFYDAAYPSKQQAST